MINIREDGILEIEEIGLFEDDKDVLFNSYEINLNSIYNKIEDNLKFQLRLACGLGEINE